MSVVYTLYDALVSIKVPDDKVKAVIDALEREMMDKIATKADVLHLRDSLSRDINSLARDLAGTKDSLSKDIQRDIQVVRSEMEHRFERLESRLTIKLGTVAGAWTAVLFGLLKLSS
jgi:hypothetical protein